MTKCYRCKEEIVGPPYYVHLFPHPKSNLYHNREFCEDCFDMVEHTASPASWGSVTPG